MFYLKKIIGALLMPLPICFALLGIGLVLLWRGKATRTRTAMLSGGVLLLFAFSFAPLVNLGVETLERRYPGFEAAQHPDMAWVVVLGGGTSDDPSLAANNQLSGASLARLVEGLRILRRYPDARLLVSGAAVFSTRTEAQVMRETAWMLGADTTRIRMDEASMDTEAQAVNVKALVVDAPFVLVTSAYHMPRSMALFEKQGLSPVPAPTAYLYRRSRQFDARILLPGEDTLGQTKAVFHEYLGLAWAWLNGRV